MLLLRVMVYFRQRGWIGGARALHVDYGTWGEEGPGLGQLLREVCKALEVPLISRQKPLERGASNFEMRARLLRLEEFRAQSSPDTWVVTGHHLDDSLEWSLMQQMKGQSLRALLGIPLRHGRILRPLLCLTRAQITALCAHNGIAYRDDPTNGDGRF